MPRAARRDSPSRGRVIRRATARAWDAKRNMWTPDLPGTIEGVALTNPAPVAVALDAPDLETAARWAGLVTPHVSTVKIGLELYLQYGPNVVASIKGASGVRVFLDLKL